MIGYVIAFGIGFVIGCIVGGLIIGRMTMEVVQAGYDITVENDQTEFKPR